MEKKKGNKERGQPRCLTRVTAFVRLAPVKGVTTRSEEPKERTSVDKRRRASGSHSSLSGREEEGPPLMSKGC